MFVKSNSVLVVQLLFSMGLQTIVEFKVLSTLRVFRTSMDKAPAAKKLYASSPVPNDPLDVEQKDVLDACLSGRNVFFTGSAGTGKSYLLKKIIGALPPDVTVATASTGL